MRLSSKFPIFLVSGRSVMAFRSLQHRESKPILSSFISRLLSCVFSTRMAASAVGRHEDREAKAGQMVQRLINPDEGPEPGMVRRHVEGRGAEPLGAIDRDVNEEVDDRDEPESWRDDQDQR